jgi:hypothetical protein
MTSRFAAVVVALCTVAFHAHAADRDVEALNVALRKRGASWFARESSISRLPAAQRAALAGVLDEPPPRTAHTRAAPAGLPTHLDWRDHGGNFVTSVKNQGGCGSCWAFAAVAVAESALLIEHNTPGVDIDLSEQFLLSCAGAGTCLGGVADLSVDILAQYGARTEQCFPYSFYDEACLHGCADPDEIVPLRASRRIPADDVAIKEALLKGPITTCFTIYDDFYSYGGGVYEPVSATITGAHAVELIGYDDAEQAWIAKNQWSADWGEQGFFRIRYGAAGIGWCGAGFEQNRAPNLSVPRRVAIAAGETLELDLGTRDPDGDDVIVEVQGLLGAVIDNGVLRYTPGAERGDLEVTFTARDDVAVSLSTTVTMTISVCNEACNDSNPCTQETCPAGVCTHNNDDDAVCDDDGDACTSEQCSGGVCHRTEADGVACDDDFNPCTLDTCQQGRCDHDSDFMIGTTCVQGDDCTTATCIPGGVCVGQAINEGGSCTDHRSCTVDDRCERGRCTGRLPEHCNDGIDCTQDECSDEIDPFNRDDRTPFLDIATRPDVVDLHLDGDDVSSAAIDIGFDYTIGGPVPRASRRSMFVSTNGVVRFDAPELRFTPVCFSSVASRQEFESIDEFGRGASESPDELSGPTIGALWHDWRCERADGCRVFTALVEDDTVGLARVVQWQGLRSVLEKDSRVTVELLLLQAGGWHVRVGSVLGSRQYFGSIGDGDVDGAGRSFVCGPFEVNEALRVATRADNATTQCRHAPPFGSCVADDQCVPSGTTHADNVCLVCLSDGYEPVKGDCDDGQRCSVDDRCTPDGCIGTPPPACDDGLACTLDGCTDINGGAGAACTHVAAQGFCFIDGDCFVDGDVHPTDLCLVCDADRDREAWTARDFVACDDSDDCTANDVCTDGTCAGDVVCSGGELALGETCSDDDLCAGARCGSTTNHGEICCGPTGDCCIDDSDCAGGVCAVDHTCRVIITGTDDDDNDLREPTLGGGCATTGEPTWALLGALTLLLARRRRIHDLA